jgi:dTMP kinase
VTGRFIAFEGGDASGKSTQARRVASDLGAVLTREPGGTALGEMLRSLVLEPTTQVDLRAEALMIAAARAQHVAEVVRPALDADRHVVTDRFTGSSLAYQGYASGLDIAAVRQLSAFATEGLWPDLTVLIDVPVEVSMARLGGAPDRFEREAGEFHDKVRKGYLDLASTDDSWVVIDGTGSVEDVAAMVDAALLSLS